ncbi:MAG: lipoate--protein ligase family protein [Candidatus Bipolaricaulaceae bacterium]
MDLGFLPPAHNLALEEVILGEVAAGRAPPTLRIWRNPRCVVVGRGQRAAEEADLASCMELGIPVLKRATGGGAVYHHPGNLNFSLFLPLSGPWSTVRSAQDRLTGLLAQEIGRRWGLAAEARGGAVVAAGVKLSGSAQLRRRALLHHGTLLVKADRIPMGAVLLALRPGYAPSGVPSCPHPVGDLTALCGRAVSLEEGVRALLRAFRPLGRPTPATPSLREWALAWAAAAQ